MSLEQKIEALTAAIEANTAALQAAGGSASTAKTETTTGKPGRPPKDKGEGDTGSSKPKFTREQVNAALVKIKDANGAEAAKKIIADVAGVAKMADIKDSKFEAVIEACEKALGGDAGDDDNL